MAALITRPVGVLEPDKPKILSKSNLYIGVGPEGLKVVDLGKLDAREVLNRVYGSVSIESSTAAIFSNDESLQGSVFFIWNVDVGREYQLQAEVLSLSLLKGDENIMVLRGENILFYYDPREKKAYESPELKNTNVLPGPVSDMLYFSGRKTEFLSMLRTIGKDKYSDELSSTIARELRQR
ncbi:MAG: hypothetical protein ACP5MK_02880 [Candidatus Micrarchaeia archaeon]